MMFVSRLKEVERAPRPIRRPSGIFRNPPRRGTSLNRAPLSTPGRLQALKVETPSANDAIFSRRRPSS